MLRSSWVHDGPYSTSLILSGQSEPNSTITVYSSTAGSLGSTTANIGGYWSYTTQPLAAGRHELTVTAADAVGNVSSPSDPLVVIIDTVAPSAPSVPDLAEASDSGSSNSDNITNVENAVFTGTAEAHSMIRLFSSSNEIGSAIADPEGKWSITASALADGSHDIIALAEDIAGNTSSASGMLRVIIDTAKPPRPEIFGITRATDLGASDTDGITSNNAPVFCGTAETGTTVVVTSSSAGDIGSVMTDPDGNWSIASGHLQDGVYVLTAKCIDLAGNISDDSTECTVTIDTERPVVSISAPSSAITGNDDVTFTITYAGADSITLAEGDINLIKTGTADGTVSVSGAAANERTVTVSNISGDGTLAIEISAETAADLAGNVALACGPSAVVTADNTAPVVSDGQISFSGLSANSVTLEWVKATDNICAQNVLKYLVYRSSSDNLSTVSDIEANGTPMGLLMPDINTSVIIGLSHSTTYYFNIIVCDEAGNKNCYTPVQITTGQAPSSWGGGTSAPAEKNGREIEVLKEGLSTMTVQNPEGQSVVTIAVDSYRILDRLASTDNGGKVIVEVSSTNNVITSIINGDILDTMAQKESVLEIRTGNATYALPASEINMADISGQLGENITLNDIKVNITIAEPPADTVKIVEDTANKNNYQVVVDPVEFTVSCSVGNKTIEVERFSGYVERLVAIPDGIDPTKITTGVILNQDGTLTHVPTTIVQIDGRYFAKISSLTNSTYTVIYNKAEFSDIQKHWAAADIVDMASRLVIDGAGSDIFGPELKITRGEFIDAVIRALGLKRNGTGKKVFDDVDEECPYFDSIFTAYQYRFAVGVGGGLFKPDSNITRQEAMTILTRVMPLLKMDVNISDKEAASFLEGYSDGKSLPGWARNNAAVCIRSGIIEGSNGMIMGTDNITKAQTAVVLKRLLKKAGLI